MCGADEKARYIIGKCSSENNPISNLQLQKLLYFVQKAFLKAGKEAFDDDFEAWRFGPVIPEVYYSYSGYGSRPIFSIRSNAEISLEDKQIIDSIVEKNINLPPWELAKSIHRINGAWDKTFNHGAGKNKIIDKELIRSEM